MHLNEKGEITSRIALRVCEIPFHLSTEKRYLVLIYSERGGIVSFGSVSEP
jgi:hypothetical protein